MHNVIMSKKGGEKMKTGTGEKASKASGAIAKLRANNSALAAALQSKKQECEEMKVENMELKNELQILHQQRITMTNGISKCRPLLMQLALHWMNAEDSLLELQKEFDSYNCDANGSTTISTGDLTARVRLRERYSLNKGDFMAAAAGDNLSVIVERSTLTEESPKASGSGLQAEEINSKTVRKLIPRVTNTAKPKPVIGKKPSKAVANPAPSLKTKSELPKAKKTIKAKPRQKLAAAAAAALPIEEMPAFRPTFQIPRTPSKDEAGKEVGQVQLKLDTVVCNVTRLPISQIEAMTASLPEKTTTAETELKDDGKMNTTFDKKTPGTLAESVNSVKTRKSSPRGLRASIPFSLDASPQTNHAKEIAPLSLLDIAGPSNGVDKPTKAKKPRKKAEPKKKKANAPIRVQIESPAAETENMKRVEKRKSRRNTLIEEENFKIPSPKVTPSPKKKKLLSDSHEKKPRRAASSVTYKEPSLNRKMRRQ